MTEAIFGLVGVVIGGLLNGFVSWLADHRREGRSVKVAARLVQSEMEVNNLAVSGALFKEKTWSPLKSLLSVSEWTEHRPTLAAKMKDEDWSLVDNYYSEIQATKSLAATHSPFDPIDQGETARLAGMAERIVKADAAMRTYSNVHSSELAIKKARG